MASSPRAPEEEEPALTVGDVNARSHVPRALMWAVAVYLPSACMATVSVVAYCIYYNVDSIVPAMATAWWLPPVMLSGAYVAALTELMMYMHLFLPRTPVSVPEALLDVGVCWVGCPLECMAIAVAMFGEPWMAAALDCVLVLLIAGLVAWWMRLARTYNSSSDLVDDD